MSRFPYQQQYFAEYSLWNDSTYSNRPPYNPIHFTRPVYEESVFLSPNYEQKAITDGSEQNESTNTGTYWFESYFRRSSRVIPRADLLKHPDLFHENEPPPPADGGPSFWTHTVQPYSPPLVTPSRCARIANSRGRKTAMQRRLEKALQQPARMDKGASIMARMGWDGGALGRGGEGIIDPIAPNAQYAYSTSGFGSEDREDSPDIEPIAPPPKRPKTNRQPREKKEHFKTNVLLHILDFIKNDLQTELYFETTITKAERKRIHQTVAALHDIQNVGRRGVYQSKQQRDTAIDIYKRNSYILKTQSEGIYPNRQLCVYKEAPDYMYLVTPEDIRNPEPDEPDEEPNPFLKSITKYIKDDEPEPPNDYEPSIFDRLVQYFIDFANDEYTEFRFLGPFVMDEIGVMSTFLGLLSGLAKNEPRSGPEELLRVFQRGVKYSVDEDANGYVTIKKLPENMDIQEMVT